MMLTISSPLLNAALEYHKRGWSIFPVGTNKKPLTQWGEFQTVPAEEHVLNQWWKQWPDANLGLACGPVSGVVVLDVDNEEGYRILKEKGLTVPETLMQRTGKGFHHFFADPGVTTHNFTRGKREFPLPFIDFRGRGGYVILAPSLHENGRRYEWLNDVPLAPLPVWLLDIVAEKARADHPRPALRDPASPALLERLFSKAIADAPAGKRNETGFWLACQLRDNGVPQTEGSSMMRRYAEAVRDLGDHAYTDDEAMKSIESVYRQPAREPWATNPRMLGISVSDSGVLPDTPEAWSDPKPIKAELLPVEPLELKILPEPFRPFVQDIAERMQIPPDAVAVAVVAMAGAVIGAGCGIRPKRHDDWLVTPNLWGGVVGRPSMLKTPSIKEAMKSLGVLEDEANAAHEAAKLAYEADSEVYKAHREAIKSEMTQTAKGKKSADGSAVPTMDSLKHDFTQLEEPRRPIWRRYKTNDSTIEKVSELLAENDRGLLLFRDELVGLLATWDKEGHETDRAFFLETWNGTGSYTSDRIGRGTTYTKNMCLTVFGGIQPAKLQSYLHSAMRGHNNDGLVQRLQLMVYPDEPKSWTLMDRTPDLLTKQRTMKVISHLAAMDFTQHGAILNEGQSTPYFNFDQDAQEVFNEWLTRLEREKLRADDEPVILEHLGKYRSLMPALAEIFHLVAVADGTAAGAVSKKAAAQAADYCDYLEHHARRIYGMVTNLTQQAAARLASKIEQGSLKSPFTVWDVGRKNWALFDDKAVILGACEELIDAGWLKPVITPTSFGQKGKTDYHINPKVRG